MAQGLLAGRTIGGRYELIDLVGVGGMGEVYRARDRELDDVLAIKVIREELAALPGVLEQFRSEVKLARRVTHRNVARTYELGRADGITLWVERRADLLAEEQRLTGGSARWRAFLTQLVAEAAGREGDLETALDAIRRGCADGMFDRPWIEHCPLLAGVREDPRFAPLAAQVIARAHAVHDALYGDHRHLATAPTSMTIPPNLTEIAGCVGRRRGLHRCLLSRTIGAMVVRMSDDKQSPPPNQKREGGTGLVLEERSKTKKPPMYKVLLHNDDYTTREFVVWLLTGVFHKSEGDAIAIMSHVHNNGVGVAGVYTFEVAETKVTKALHLAKAQQYPLQLSIEPTD